MEKRIILAMTLSLMVLYFWGALFSPQSSTNYQKTNTFLAEPQKEFVKQPREDVVSREFSQNNVIKEPLLENTQIIDNNVLMATFSDVGGNLKEVEITKFKHVLPVYNFLNVAEYENERFVLKEKTRNSVIYFYEDKNIKITKTYLLGLDYLIKADIKIENVSRMSKNIKNIYGFSLDISSLDKMPNYSQESSLFEYFLFSDKETIRRNNANKFSNKETKTHDVKVNMFGFRDRYNCAIVKPEFDANKFNIEYVNEKKINFSVSPTENSQNVQKYDLNLYFGPQDKSILKKFNMGFENIISYRMGGFFEIMTFGLSDVICSIILEYLNFLFNIFKNWGWSIIILSISIYVITLPLSLKSMISMRKMQVLQPQIKALQERNKSNPEKAQKEMMQFYKDNKVNPFSGCLPAILQMPIFIVLYQIFWRSIDFKGATFLWIKDLSEPDHLFQLPAELPFIGKYFNILPIIAVGFISIQQFMSSKSLAVADPSQASQQKMMSIFMTIMFAAIFYNFSSGYSLYWAIFYLLTTITQGLFYKKIKASENVG